MGRCRNGHNSLARIVFASSPVRRRGSTLNLAPSISPTPNSLFEPLTSLSLLPCVPPVMRSVFFGTPSFGVNLESTLVMSSGGGASLPTDGISLTIVDVVFVMCGFNGLDFWKLRYLSEVSFVRLFRASNSLLRMAERVKARHWVRGRVRRAREERATIREDAILRWDVRRRNGGSIGVEVQKSGVAEGNVKRHSFSITNGDLGFVDRLSKSITPTSPPTQQANVSASISINSPSHILPFLIDSSHVA